mmetsp:Transcript_46048/g.73545  ORF Transcript_46048/g.73545 Transcript_46048/m.73545 type:complete len:89 (+) Transcript_46048:97-363(+)
MLMHSAWANKVRASVFPKEKCNMSLHRQVANTCGHNSKQHMRSIHSFPSAIHATWEMQHSLEAHDIRNVPASILKIKRIKHEEAGSTN